MPTWPIDADLAVVIEGRFRAGSVSVVRRDSGAVLHKAPLRTNFDVISVRGPVLIVGTGDEGDTEDLPSYTLYRLPSLAPIPTVPRYEPEFCYGADISSAGEVAVVDMDIWLGDGTAETCAFRRVELAGVDLLSGNVVWLDDEHLVAEAPRNGGLVHFDRSGRLLDLAPCDDAVRIGFDSPGSLRVNGRPLPYGSSFDDVVACLPA